MTSSEEEYRLQAGEDMPRRDFREWAARQGAELGAAHRNADGMAVQAKEAERCRQ